MMTEYKHFIEGNRIYLRDIVLSDAHNKDYCKWMNDQEVVQYTESRFQKHTVRTLRSYILQINRSNNVFLAIVLKDGNRHIGNIKIGSINPLYYTADIGIIIGEKSCWGKGYGTEAIRLTVEYAFHNLNLHKLWAGAYECNTGSINAFIKAGFTQEGLQKEQAFFNHEFIDVLLFGIINKDFSHSGANISKISS